jgi:hypothetical protein
MSGAMPPLLHVTSCLAQGQLCLHLLFYSKQSPFIKVDCCVGTYVLLVLRIIRNMYIVYVQRGYF